MTLSGKPSTGTPGTAEAQVATDSGADTGQVQERRSERGEDSILRKKNSENRGLRNELHATRSELEKFRKEAADREAEVALKRGEVETLYHNLRSQYDALMREHADTVLAHAVQTRIGSKKVKREAIEDVLRLLPKDGLRLNNGDVDGLDEALEDFLSKRPWLLEEANDSAQEVDGASHGDPEGIWAEARAVGYRPSGHAGYRPSGQTSGRMPITEEMKEQAAVRDMDVEDWREVLEYREEKRLAREGKR